MDLNKKTFFILTGASKGIGKTFAVECCRKFKPNSVAVLIARSEKGLQETRQEILDLKNDINVKIYSRDLSTALAEEYTEILSDALVGLDVNEFERAFIVHNVGSLGDVTKTAKELSDIDSWQNYFHLNMFGVCALNVEFMKIFKPISKVVINITSMCSIVPFPSMAEYCCGKAAREMYFRVLAVEDKDTVVLNYSPGPVNTDMTVILQNESVDDGIRETFRKSRDEKSILAPETTAARFLTILEEFKFKSGDRVDYYDGL